MFSAAEKGGLHGRLRTLAFGVRIGVAAFGHTAAAADLIRRDHKVSNRLPADQMLLNDAFEIALVAMSIPGSFRVDDGDWSLGTNPATIRLRSKDGTLRGDEVELPETPLQELPRDFLFLGG